MSFLKATWWRPVTALAVLALAVLALSLSGTGTAQAGGDGTVSITPNPKEIGVGGQGTVSVELTPANAGTSIWIIKAKYDPSVAQVAVNAQQDPICTNATAPSGFETAFATGCDTQDTDSDQIADTIVVFGGAVKNDGGTAVGLTAPITLATFTFNAVGADGSQTALTTTVASGSMLSPQGAVQNPAVNNGLIKIVASQGTSRIWGNSDCSADGVTSRDGQAVLKIVLQKTPLSQEAGCPAVGATVTVDGTSRIWGNWDCSGDGITSRDSQAVLKNVLQKTPLSQEAGCPAVGATVTVS